MSELEALSESFIGRLLSSIDVDPKRLVVLRKAVYSFHARQASSWRLGPALLLGDAAHCMPPFKAVLPTHSHICTGTLKQTLTRTHTHFHLSARA